VLCDDQRCEPCAEDREHMDASGRAGSQSVATLALGSRPR
jgi:hypothetical protein